MTEKLKALRSQCDMKIDLLMKDKAKAERDLVQKYDDLVSD